MKKLFICQTTKGKSQEEVLAERANIVKICQETFGNLNILNSFDRIPSFEEDTTLFELASALLLLNKADIAYFAKGWSVTKAKFVHDIALSYNIIVVEESLI